MRKLAIALVAATVAMTSAAHADWNGRRQYQHYHGGGGGNGGAIFGGIVGGMILGGMLNQMAQPRYAQPQYYQQYEPECQRVFAGNFWNGYQWVQQWQMICQ
jgi:hypothetical protein